jgi:hypothetical protein
MYEEALGLSHRTGQQAPRAGFDGTLFISYNAAMDELQLGTSGRALVWVLPGLLRGEWAGAPLYIAIGGGSALVELNCGQVHLDNFLIDRGSIIKSMPF